VYLKILIPFVIIAALLLFYKQKKRDFLDTGVQKLVQKKSDGLYKISYDSISVDEVGGDLFIKNLYIKGDTARQMQMVRSGDSNAQKVVLDIYIPLLHVVDFKTAAALLSKQIVCSRIILNEPKATAYFFPGYGKQQDEGTQRKELYKQILGDLKLIQADSVSINNAGVVAIDYFTRQTKFRTYNTSISLDDIRIDSTYREDTSRTLFCKQIRVKAPQVRLGDNRHATNITGLTFDTRSKVVFLSSLQYDAFKNNGFFKTSLENVSVQGLEWKGPAERSRLSVRSVVLDKGEVETLSGSGGNNKSPAGKRILTGWIKDFSIGVLKVNSFSLISRSADEKKEPIIIKNNSLLLKNIDLDTLARLDKRLVNNIGEADFYNDELRIISQDKFYIYKLSGFRLNTKSRKVWIRQVAVIPTFSETVFAKKAKVQRDRFDVKLNSIECDNIELDKLLAGKIYAQGVITRGSEVRVFRDLSYPADGKSKLGSYPHQMLLKLNVPLNVKKIRVYNAYVEYKEKNPLSDSVGKVRFNHANVTINNVSNLTPGPNTKATVEFNCKFLDVLPFNGIITFNLYEWQKGTFKTQASISKSFDATVLNQLSQPLSLIKINSGVMDYIMCNINGDNYRATGQLQMLYRDFKVTLQRKKGEEINNKNLLTILTNTLVKNKNVAGKGMRVATIDKERDLTKSFFNFLWKSIFSGGMEILGVKPK
jgi:hypothetical protein